MIEYHIYIFVKIQNAIFKTNLDLASILSKQPKAALNGDHCSTLDGARQALLGVTVFPAILKTLSDLELLELQRQSVPCGREE